MNAYHNGQRDDFMNQRFLDRDMRFLQDVLSNIANVDINAKDRDILCLQAKNFLSPKQVEQKLAIFEAYQQQSNKQARG